MTATAAIISIGAEILTGRTLDRNSNALAKALTGIGFVVSEIRVIPDSKIAIVASVRTLLGTNSLIVTTGGLGATPDDLTLESVAAALELPLVHSHEVEGLIRTRYAKIMASSGDRSSPPEEAVQKLSKIPRGGVTLNNSAGVAPGIGIQKAAVTIISLPGVPRELTSVFESFDSTRLLREAGGTGGYAEYTTETSARFETDFLSIIERMKGTYRERVLVKPRVKRFGEDVRILVRIAATGEDFISARTLAQEAMVEFRRLALETGIDSAEPTDS